MVTSIFVLILLVIVFILFKKSKYSKEYATIHKYKKDQYVVKIHNLGVSYFLNNYFYDTQDYFSDGCLFKSEEEAEKFSNIYLNRKKTIKTIKS